MQDFLLDMLVCPQCQNDLIWDIQQRRGDHVEVAEARCSDYEALYGSLYEKVSLLAIDAHRMPFRDGAAWAMTTNIGLPSIEHPGGLLKELQYIVAGRFLAISSFFPPGDEANNAVIR